MFFTHDRAWEEFFCVCIQLLNKTWKEMRATAEDFNKVGINPLNRLIDALWLLHSSPPTNSFGSVITTLLMR